MTTAYLPPIQYVQKFVQYDHVEIESYSHYEKQSYRNRCQIVGANGILPLIIPVTKKGHTKCLDKDIRILYSENWQHIHRQSICSAYGSSPFFLYYQDEFMPFYQKKWHFLMDFNTELLFTLLKLLGIKNAPGFSKAYHTEKEGKDFRHTIHPKSKKQTPDHEWKPAPYLQVFDQKTGFIPNMSIIDLLFNTGTQAFQYLQP